MDKGAHFFKCDFQVHTPRDTRWFGQEAVTEQERQEYAKEFIRACRIKSLNAVAITDHHDLAFFKYIKEAANSELDDSNNPIPRERKIVVFPGMELTLGVPCQAIIIFDADFPIDLLPTAYTVLSINSTDAAQSRHAQPVRLERIKKLSELYEELNGRDYLKNKFIILPKVLGNPSVNQSLLKQGIRKAHDDIEDITRVGEKYKVHFFACVFFIILTLIFFLFVNFHKLDTVTCYRCVVILNGLSIFVFFFLIFLFAMYQFEVRPKIRLYEDRSVFKDIYIE